MRGTSPLRRGLAALLLLLFVVSLAAGGWFVLGGGGDGEDDAASVERAAEGEIDRDLATLKGRADASPAPEVVTPPVERPADEVASPTEGLYRLRGEILGLAPGLEGVVRVRAYPVEGIWPDHAVEPASCAADHQGRFLLDVTGLLRDERDVTGLDVLVDHPNYVQGKARVDAAAARAKGEGELVVRVTVHPGLAVVGEVREPGGSAVAKAAVAVFVSGPDGPVMSNVMPIQPLAATTSDAEGRFRARVSKPGTYLVVAHAENRQPAGADAHLTSGVEVALPPLVLRQGVAIEGRIAYEDGLAAPAWVHATAAHIQGRLVLQVGEIRVGWTPGPVLQVDAWVETDMRGRFRIPGLTPGPHRLEPSNFQPKGIGAVCMRVAGDFEIEVDAPSQDVVLSIAGAGLEVRVTGDGGPVADAHVRFECEGSSVGGSTDDTGRVRALLAPDRDYVVRAERDGFEARDTAVHTGPVGSTDAVELTLPVAAPRPVVVVTFTGAGAETLERAWIRFRDVGQSGGMPSETHDKEQTGPGTWRLKNLPPGRHELILKPGCGFWQETGYLLPETREIEVPVAGEIHVTVPLRVGGRLRIAARDEAGALVDADCTIEDADGEELEVLFSTHADKVAMSSPSSLGALSPATVAPALPAGTYTLLLGHENFEGGTVTAVVEENETTEVEVPLARR